MTDIIFEVNTVGSKPFFSGCDYEIKLGDFKKIVPEKIALEITAFFLGKKIEQMIFSYQRVVKSEG